MVVPNPRSSGSATNLPYVPVRLLSSGSSFLGLIRSRQSLCMWSSALLLRVQLDDQLLVDRHGEVSSRGQRLDGAGEVRTVDFEPLRYAAPLRQFERLLNADDLAAAIADSNDVARPNQRRRNVEL